MMNISKTTLADIQVHLQHGHETIEFLQLEWQLQSDELQQQSSSSKSFNHTNEYKDVDSKSFIQPTSSVEVVPVQLSSKPIINPWEEFKVIKIDKD